MRLPIILILTLSFKLAYCQQESIRARILLDVKHNIREDYYYPHDTSFIFSILDTFQSPYPSIDDFLWDLTSVLRTKLNQKHFNFLSNDTSRVKTRKRTYLNRKIARITWKFKRRSIRKKLTTDAFEYGPILKLPDNVGYIKINSFENKYFNPSPKTPRFKNVIKRLKLCNAIIIDLTDNRGGLIHQTANLTSYFAPADSIYLFSVKTLSLDSLAKGKKVYEYHNYLTNNNVARLNTKKIIVLIGKQTFSAGEHAAYALKKLSNTIIIGDTTAASGLSCNIGLGNKYADFDIPTFKIVDTLNSYSFEKHGVIPDIIDTGDSTIWLAYRLAHEDTTNISPLNPKDTVLFKMKYNLVEDYGRIKILERSGSLFIQYDRGPIEKITNYKGELKSKNFVSISYTPSRPSNQIKVTMRNGKIETYSRR